MRTSLLTLLIGGLASTAIGLGCTLPAGLAPPPASGNAAQTAAARTVVAAMTGLARNVTPAPLWAATLPPPYTPTPPSAAASPIPSAATASLPCNRATFVRDVTVPDGSEFRPGADFTKTWQLRNTGACTWSRGYALVFEAGDRMSGAESQPLEREVIPGESIDLALALEAPENVGDYRGLWKLRSGGGERFGIGEQGTNPFWVAIRVSLPDEVVYNLVEEYCEADWSTASGDLPCPGEAGSPEGFVVRLEEAVMEGGRKENEPGLWTNPEAVEDGRIRGEFPGFKIEKGDVFAALISCLDNSPECSVRMRLQYRIGDGSIQTLAEGTQTYDDEFRKVEVDLSELAGHKVKLILAAETRGDDTDDTAFWLMPRIMR